MPIKEYLVVTDEEYLMFLARITDLIREGWEPIGGVSVTEKGFYQAMVKR